MAVSEATVWHGRLTPKFTSANHLRQKKFYCIGPRTRYIALDILETELLPSDVVKIKFYRPPNMKVLSGEKLFLAIVIFERCHESKDDCNLCF